MIKFKLVDIGYTSWRLVCVTAETSRHSRETDLSAIQRKEGLDLSSLETGVMGGAPCPIELCRAMTEELNIKEMAVS